MPNHRTRPRIFALLAILSAWMLPSAVSAQDAPKPLHRPQLDVLVIAPHPDDEVIGCAGVMLQALAQHKNVGIVFLTNGDGFAALAAAAAKKEKDQITADDFIRAGALRQQHAVRATARIGVPRGELMFLGYPDSGLEKIHATDGDTPFQQKFTLKSETYGVTARDYHSVAHGKPAPYVKASVVGDLAEIIRERQPREIYVTSEADKHADHRIAFSFVRDAVRSVNFRGDLFTYIVHGAPPSASPDRRVTLTAAQIKIKRSAIEDHQAGTSPVHDHLADEYMKPEELFWKIRVEPAAAK